MSIGCLATILDGWSAILDRSARISGIAKGRTVNEMTATPLSVDQLVEHAWRMANMGGRQILGIAGAPGAGKSTLAQQIVEALGSETAALVPMDGFHLANEVLNGLGRHERKGAFDTFDSWGYAALLQRLRRQTAPGGDPVVYAPQFRRDLEEPIGSAIPVLPTQSLIVTEGNYLLLDRDAWPSARAVIDEVWFLVPPEEIRLERLFDRHMRFGRSREEAWARSLGSDQRNAEQIRATASGADLLVALSDKNSDSPL